MKSRSLRMVAVLFVVLGFLVVASACSSDDTDAGNGADAPAAQQEGQDGEEAREAQNAERRESAREAEAEMRRHRREQAEAAALTPEEEEAKEAAQSFYNILAEDSDDPDSTDIDAAAFCDLMSQEAREQTIEYARVSSGIAQEWNCVNSVELLVIRSKRTGGAEATANARVVGINAEGDRATASVRFGRGPISSIPLVREDGEWKLGSSPVESGN